MLNYFPTPSQPNSSISKHIDSNSFNNILHKSTCFREELECRTAEMSSLGNIQSSFESEGFRKKRKLGFPLFGIYLRKEAKGYRWIWTDRMERYS